MNDREKAVLWLGCFLKNKEEMVLIPKPLVRLMYEALTQKPTADVRPVVRGEWEKRYRKNRSGDYEKLDRCSVCGEPIPYKMLEDITEYISGYQANFCPNCGADMRKEDGTDNV